MCSTCSHSFVFPPASEFSSCHVCMDLNRRTSVPNVPASRTGMVTFLCQCGHIYRHDSPATLQFQPENLMRQQECRAVVVAAWRGSEPRLAWSTLRPPVASPHCRACPLARQHGWVPSLEPLCVCSCLVVIRSSQCTTAPSHLKGGSAGHTAPFSASAALVPVSHRDGESWNSRCLLVLNLNP